MIFYKKKCFQILETENHTKSSFIFNSNTNEFYLNVADVGLHYQ